MRIAFMLSLLIAATMATAAPPHVPSGGAVAVTIDVSADVRPFSQDIFGVSFGDAARNAQVGYTVRRWGGNSVTRYNWQVDVHNTASDYFYENIPGSHDRTEIPPLGNDADAFVGEALDAGSQPLITIPTIGWTPRADSPLNHPYFAGFSVARYGAQQFTDPFDPDAGNGVRPDGTTLVTGNDPHDTSSEVGAAFQQGWVAHLQATFGGASGGGVKFYSLDNEVMLWNSTHRDVHPAPATYDETWANAHSYGGAIKQQDPAAKVTGPVTWGYCDLFGSAADNCLDGPDRQAHDGLPFVAWYLQQVCANPLAGGARVVDYLDLHYYPQGNVALNDDDSPSTAARRLRSLKELYDPTWVSESWIADLGDTDEYHYDKPNLIPRVRAWIDQYCPGTKLAITEYNWGNDGTVSGAVAQAELFGIFAREGVDLATRWVAPGADTRVERAYTLFLNYDGAGSKVQGSSVSVHSADIDRVGAYAFVSAGRTMVLLTNKDTVAHDAALTFAGAQSASWRLFGFDANNGVHQIGTGTISGTALTLTGLPAISANLLVIEASDAIFADGFEQG
jgi:hypothetical protein